MAEFNQALRKVLRHEGVVFNDAGAVLNTGYVDHPDDPGGETNWGIIVDVARAFGYLGPMRALPYSIVQAIYRRNYWDEIQGDVIPDQEIAEELFDTGVNCGMGTAIRFLQRTLNVLNVKATKYADIAVDGDFGEKSVAALKAALQVKPWYRTAILRTLDSLQCTYYITLAEKNEKFETFMPGWLRTRVGGHE